MRVLFYYRGSEQLGIEAMSALLKQEGHEVGLLYDPGADNVFYFQLPIFEHLRVEDLLVKQAIEFQPDVIAFSCITNLYPYVKSIANRLKQHLNIPFVMGGVHPSTLPDKIMEDGLFDYLCIGEGDYAFIDLLNAIEQDGDTTVIANIHAKIDGKIFKNDTRPLIEDLDTLPIPDKSLFYDRGAFFRSLLVMTSRGCPFKCSFCVNNFYHEIKDAHEKPVRQQSVPYAIRAMESYLAYGRPRHITFLDDIFGLNPAWMEEFATVYPKKIGLPFLANVYPSAVTRKYASLLKKAGCSIAMMGVQSGSPEVRKRMLRKETNEQIEQSSRYLNEAGIELNAGFIFGYPEETADQMWESVELSQRIASHGTTMSTFVFYPFPETDAQRQADAASLINESQHKTIAEGLGSYHTTLLMETPYKNEALNLASLLPLFSKFPRSFTQKYLRRIYKMQNNWLIKYIGLTELILLRIPWLVKERLFNISYMLLRLFTRPTFLKNRSKNKPISVLSLFTGISKGRK
jgi:anaerobic magnesium-protoporphyrin IX monomethyl ester cyclase